MEVVKECDMRPKETPPTKEGGRGCEAGVGLSVLDSVICARKVGRGLGKGALADFRCCRSTEIFETRPLSHCQHNCHCRHSSAMSDGASLRELSSTLASFTQSQSQIKSIFSMYDHDSDGYLTTSQALLLVHVVTICV